MEVGDRVRHKRLGLGTVKSLYQKNFAARVEYDSGHVTTNSQKRIQVVVSSAQEVTVPETRPEPPKRRRRDHGIDYDMMERARAAISADNPEADNVVPKYYGGRVYCEVWGKDRSARVVFYEGE